MPAVSVIIPTFNRALKVVRAIESVFSQTFVDYEILVIDDGSTDGTDKALAEFKGRITYLAHSTNRGVSVARNTGIMRSNAPLVAFLDSDDYWLPEKLAEQIYFFESHPQTLACQTAEIWMRNGRRVNPKKRHLKPSGDIFKPSLKLCLVSPSATVLKRSVLENVGLFDEGLPACEDYDLWLRIACRYPVYLVEQPLVVKEGGSSDQLSSLFKGMDQFRIKALVKLIKGCALNPEQLEATFQELTLKCRIYGNGCLKRGKIEEGIFYLQLTEKLKEDLSHVSLDYDDPLNK